MLVQTPSSDSQASVRRSPSPPREGARRPGLTVAHVPPNWFAAVMGTGIVATAGASLPLQLPGQRTAATAVWALAAVLLAGVVLATALHWARHPGPRAGTTGTRSRRTSRRAAHGAADGRGGALLLGRDWVGSAPPSTSPGRCGEPARCWG
ncbi:hypothetical protein NBM05_11145 [Rothia sp. AR01]|uniref:C4-dicarboxylate transporter/malic acid transport protein n=1 Tax=Rothia santali TaxID=2949643 RepID=A0A9X2HE07_9MICC|nr:hypothetical protein [Rothia santali]MCP3426540.1 hypothetical protein [Rothia santali]